MEKIGLVKRIFAIEAGDLLDLVKHRRKNDRTCKEIYQRKADSIAMLHILKSIQEEFGFFLEAVHVHHGIRGDEADRDENLVKKIFK